MMPILSRIYRARHCFFCADINDQSHFPVMASDIGHFDRNSSCKLQSRFIDTSCLHGQINRMHLILILIFFNANYTPTGASRTSMVDRFHDAWLQVIWKWNKSVYAWEYGIRVGWMGKCICQ